MAPSALPADSGSPVPHALTLAEIGEVVERWGKAAARAQRAGFDVVEIHGAHGFLIHQFLSPRANQRTDAYGGSDENRMRFALEVARGAAAKIGAGRLGIRVSPFGAFNDRCVEAASTTGPVQSCGATGRCQASAMVAIFLASERPPHQERSSMTTPAASVSIRSRNAQRVASVSEAQSGARLAAA